MTWTKVEVRDLPVEDPIQVSGAGLEFEGKLLDHPGEYPHYLMFFLEGVRDSTNIRISGPDFDKFTFAVQTPTARELFNSWPIGTVFTIENLDGERIKVADDTYYNTQPYAPHTKPDSGYRLIGAHTLNNRNASAVTKVR